MPGTVAMALAASLGDNARVLLRTRLGGSPPFCGTLGLKAPAGCNDEVNEDEDEVDGVVDDDEEDEPEEEDEKEEVGMEGVVGSFLPNIVLGVLTAMLARGEAGFAPEGEPIEEEEEEELEAAEEGLVAKMAIRDFKSGNWGESMLAFLTESVLFDKLELLVLVLLLLLLLLILLILLL